jgi:hypothetical protein
MDFITLVLTPSILCYCCDVPLRRQANYLARSFSPQLSSSSDSLSQPPLLSFTCHAVVFIRLQLHDECDR